jgi:hypothetical protein
MIMLVEYGCSVETFQTYDYMNDLGDVQRIFDFELDAIFKEYSNATKISELDVLITIYALLTCDLLIKIPQFLKAVFSNKAASI